MSVLCQFLSIIIGVLASNRGTENGGSDKGSKEISIKIQINKIYGINTADQTYVVDGYLVASWTDDSVNNLEAYKNVVYENDRADEIINSQIWVPAFEFINVVGNREIANKQISVDAQQKVIYNERFNATFTAPMDFKSFPFDTQVFRVQLEAFSYDLSKLKFKNVEFVENSFAEKMYNEWDITETKSYINKKGYSHLSENGELVYFSRYNQEVFAKRKIRYYLWQLMVPLLLIISISWSVFWIPDLTDQLATNFTLMLTVVAFNFNTSSILPNLPYNTFIESLITLGYLSIFVSLLVIILGKAMEKKKKRFRYKVLMDHCKYIFPISFMLLVLIELLVFF